MPNVTAPADVEAMMLHGSPHMIDHQNGSTAIKAGEVVVVEGKARIAHLDIPANEPGSLAAGGGDATYLIKKDTGTGTAIDSGTTLYWDDTANEVTESSTGNSPIGEAVQAAANADTHVRVRHVVSA